MHGPCPRANRRWTTLAPAGTHPECDIEVRWDRGRRRWGAAGLTPRPTPRWPRSRPLAGRFTPMGSRCRMPVCERDPASLSQYLAVPPPLRRPAPRHPRRPRGSPGRLGQDAATGGPAAGHGPGPGTPPRRPPLLHAPLLLTPARQRLDLRPGAAPLSTDAAFNRLSPPESWRLQPAGVPEPTVPTSRNRVRSDLHAVEVPSPESLSTCGVLCATTPRMRRHPRSCGARR